MGFRFGLVMYMTQPDTPPCDDFLGGRLGEGAEKSSRNRCFGQAPVGECVHRRWIDCLLDGSVFGAARRLTPIGDACIQLSDTRRIEIGCGRSRASRGVVVA